MMNYVNVLRTFGSTFGGNTTFLSMAISFRSLLNEEDFFGHTLIKIQQGGTNVNRNVVSTNQAPAAIGPYSQAIKAGNFIFTSGQIPLTPEGTLAGTTIEEQTRQSLTNIRQILEAAGSSMNQVVKTTVFLADMNDFQAMNGVYAEFFGENPPARSAVQVARLPRDVKVEIEAIAYKDSL